MIHTITLSGIVHITNNSAQQRADFAKFDAILSRKGGLPPSAGDEIE